MFLYNEMKTRDNPNMYKILLQVKFRVSHILLTFFCFTRKFLFSYDKNIYISLSFPILITHEQEAIGQLCLYFFFFKKQKKIEKKIPRKITN